MLFLVLAPRREESPARREARTEESYSSWLDRERPAPEEVPSGEREAPVLELAHEARRRGDWAAALELYESIAWSETDERSRALAEHWRARVLDLAGRTSEARRAWERLAEHARDPCERLRATDRVALYMARDGDRIGAERVLTSCLDELGPRALEASEQGERVSRTLANMRAPPLLGIESWPSIAPRAGAPAKKIRVSAPLGCSQAPFR